MIDLTIEALARAVGGRVVPESAAERLVGGPVETDSRDIVPGGVFVAKPGEATDGHRFVPAAVEAGAALVIVEHEVDTTVPQVIVRDAVQALADLARTVVAEVRAAGDLRVVGITGSNGKTTTKNLLRAVCALAGPTVASRASYNNEVGGPLTMLEVERDTRFLVAEMGASRIGDIARLIAIAKPDVGVVLKVGLAHAGEFGGIENTVAAKSEMVTGLDAGDWAVLNTDDGRVEGMAAVTAAQVLRFGRGDTADVRARDVVADATGTRFVLELPGGAAAPVSFRVLGEHHVANALAAAAAAFLLGIGLDTIVAGLQSVTRAERWRMEVVAAGDVTVINDAYNASPDSMAAALKTLAQIAPAESRTVAVLGEMTELGDLAGEEHDAIGTLAVRLNIGQLVVVGPGAKRMHLAAGREGSWDGESVYADTLDEAEAMVAALVRPGDVVLVKSSNSAGLRHLGDRLGARFADGAAETSALHPDRSVVASHGVRDVPDPRGDR